MGADELLSGLRDYKYEGFFETQKEAYMQVKLVEMECKIERMEHAFAEFTNSIKDLNVEISKYYRISNEIEMDNHELTPYTNKVRVKYYDKEYAKEKCNFITNKYGKYVTSHYVSKGYALEIVNNNVDKSIAIEYVRNLEGINKQDVYTVGDGVTDKLMLTTFNGFKMENSCLEIEKLDISKVSSVSELIDIMGS